MSVSFWYTASQSSDRDAATPHQPQETDMPSHIPKSSETIAHSIGLNMSPIHDARPSVSPPSPTSQPSEPPASSTSQSPTPTTSPVAKSWAHFVAGGLGGMTAATLTSPLDVLKTRLQSDFYASKLTHPSSTSQHLSTTRRLLSLPQAGGRHFRETFSILSQIYNTEGPRALFKGLGPNLVGVVPARAINFYAYGNGKRLIATHLNNGHEAAWVHLLSAAGAGIVTGTATNPIWVIKTRLQLDRNRAEKVVSDPRNPAKNVGDLRRYRNSIDCVVQTVRGEGVRGLYNGLSASYLGVSESTLQWVLYEQMKAYLRRRRQGILDSGRPPSTLDTVIDWTGRVSSAGLAKCFAAALTYPHEVVRTRLRQAPEEGGVKKYRGLVQCFKLVWREEGVAGLYGGLTPHLLRVVPSAAIMFGMYEVILKGFGVESNM